MSPAALRNPSSMRHPYFTSHKEEQRKIHETLSVTPSVSFPSTKGRRILEVIVDNSEAEVVK